MRSAFIFAFLLVAFLVALPPLLKAQTTAVQILPGFLSVATTGPTACPAGTIGACWLPYTSTNPLPASTSGGN